LETTQAIEAALPPSLEAVIIADQEADVYDLFAQPRRERTQLLIRAAQNRCLLVEEALMVTEWQTLYCLHHKSFEPPDSPPPLREAVRWIAQLGGFLGRKGDGELGVKTVWIGWGRLQQSVHTREILRI